MEKRKHEVDYKVIIVELLKSGRSTKEVSLEYNLNESMISHWRREYAKNTRDLSRPKEIREEEIELRSLRKELKET